MQYKVLCITDLADLVLPMPMAPQHTIKLVVLGALALFLMIPVAMIGGLVRDRQATRESATSDIHGTWGRQQRLVGPILRVPYVERWTEQDRDGITRDREAIRYAHFLPESLDVAGVVANAVRRRGIFDVPVYETRLEISGRFERPIAEALGIDAAAMQWDRSEVALRVSDPRAVAENVQLQWAGRSVAFVPGTGAQSPHGGIRAPVGRPDGGRFSLQVVLRGSDSLLFAPAGRETRVQLRSDWPTPSFVGAWLPSESTVGADGFGATWRVSHLGRGYPQAWRADVGADSPGVIEQEITASAFGLRFLVPVDPYRMALRSTKYAILFIALTFSVFWVFEIAAGLRAHPVQYFLIGGALCLFYLLELALSEHLGFAAAYWLATGAVAALVSAYTAAVFRRATRAALVGGMLLVLYGYLFVLLRVEDYALLLGSVGLFAVLACIMYLTRRVEWYATAEGAEAR